MYDEAALEEIADQLLDRQETPTRLLADLSNVKQDHVDAGIPEKFQRFQLSLELDADDFAYILARVEAAIIETDDQ